MGKEGKAGKALIGWTALVVGVFILAVALFASPTGPSAIWEYRITLYLGLVLCAVGVGALIEPLKISYRICFRKTFGVWYRKDDHNLLTEIVRKKLTELAGLLHGAYRGEEEVSLFLKELREKDIPKNAKEFCERRRRIRSARASLDNCKLTVATRQSNFWRGAHTPAKGLGFEVGKSYKDHLPDGKFGVASLESQRKGGDRIAGSVLRI